MNSISLYVAAYAPYLLAVCGIVFAWSLVRMLSGDVQTPYKMELDRLNRDRDNALWWMIISVACAMLVVYTARRQAMSPAAIVFRPTPTPVLTYFDLVRPVPADDAAGTRVPYPTSTPIVAPTATLQNSEATGELFHQVAQPTRRILDVEPIYEGCGGAVSINQPPSGTTLSEGITLFGRAMADEFSYYRIEIFGPQTGGRWIDLLGGNVNASVTNGFLGSGRFDDWEEGIYQIELTVYNQSGRIAGTCQIQIGIIND